MKFRLVSLGLFLFVSASIAGTGPPPFTNGSPLDTGVDGNYTAIASATNLTGVINWAIDGGIQILLTSTSATGWTFFVDGQVLQGLTTATISNSKVAGILNGVSTSVPTNADGSVTLPTAFVVPGNAAAGSFTGKLDQTSPMGLITGNGVITGTPGRDDQLVVIVDPTAEITLSTDPIPAVTIDVITIPGSTIPTSPFILRGSRQSTLPGHASSDSSPSSS